MSNVNQRVHDRQTGSALVVSLILLFMVGIMGVTSMQRSILERQMTTNAIQSNLVFQIAESTTEQALNDEDNLIAAYESDSTGAAISLTLTGQSSFEISSEAELEYVGSSLVAGSSIGIFEGLRFEARGSSKFDDNSASASVEQGAVRRVPSIN